MIDIDGYGIFEEAEDDNYLGSYPTPVQVSSNQSNALNELIDRGNVLSGKNKDLNNESEFIDWKNDVKMFLQHECGEGSPEFHDFSRTNFQSSIIRAEESIKVGAFARGMNDTVSLLKSMKKRLDQTGEPYYRKDPPKEASHGSIPTIHFSPHMTQNQRQQQQQEQTMTIEIAVEQAVEQIRESSGESAAEEAKEKLNSLKTNRSWDNLKNVIIWTANAGKDIATAILPVLLNFYLSQGMVRG